MINPIARIDTNICPKCDKPSLELYDRNGNTIPHFLLMNMKDEDISNKFSGKLSHYMCRYCKQKYPIDRMTNKLKPVYNYDFMIHQFEEENYMLLLALR